MPFPLIPVLLGAATSGISAYGKYKATQAGKPGGAFKRKANTGYLRRYMSDLQGRSADRARTELAMRPALRMIGAQQKQGQRQLAYQSAQQGLEGSGIEAQKQLALQAGTTKAVAGLGESVLNQELARARQLQAAREGQRMKIAGEIGQREGAVSEANRMAQFQATEAMRQHEQRVSAAKGNIGTSMLGGAISSYQPYAAKEYGLGVETEDILKNVTDMSGESPGYQAGKFWIPGTGYVDVGSPEHKAATTGAEGGRVTKEGIAQYQDGGIAYEDLLKSVPAIGTAEEELRKKRQTELETATTAFETKKTAFETAQTEEQKRIDAANLLAEQQYRKSLKRVEETEKAKTERIAKIKSGYEDFATKEAKRVALEKQKFLTGDVEKEKEKFKAYALAGGKEAVPEIEDRKAKLLQHGIGAEQYDKAKAHYETMSEKYAGEEGIPQTFDEYLQRAIDTGQTEFWGDAPSKREQRKLKKKYKKQLKDLDYESGMTGEEFTEGMEITPKEFKIKKKLVAEDLPEYKPGVAPTKEEFVAGEFKDEAPTLVEPTEKELLDIRRKAIKSQLRAGVDVRGNIAKAKTNREAVNFYQNVGNMTTDQIWADPYAVANPAKVATYLSKDKKARAAEDKQFRQHAAINEYITASQVVDDPLTPGNEKDLAMSNVVNTPAFIKADPSTKFRIINETQQSMNASAKSRATDVKRADKFANVKNEISNFLHVINQLGEGTKGQDLMNILNEAGNEESITEAHLNKIKELLGEIDISGVDVDAQIKAAETAGYPLSKDMQNLLRSQSQQAGGEEKRKFDLKILNKLNKEEFRRDEDQYAQSGNIPTISSQADYNALPPGSSYIAPDGSKRVKN